MNGCIDEDLPRSLGQVLSELGFTVFDIRDYGLRGHPDSEIFQFAQKQNAVLFSADLGFSNLLDFPIGSHHGIVILRFPSELPTRETNQEVKRLLAKLLPTDYPGNLTIVSPGKIRLRRN